MTHNSRNKCYEIGIRTSHEGVVAKLKERLDFLRIRGALYSEEEGSADLRARSERTRARGASPSPGR